MLLLAATGCTAKPKDAERVAPVPTLDTGQMAVGREVYVRLCASCHGARGEGAENWATPGPDGLHPAPAHDDTGHTWHHPDRVLFEVITNGMSDPLRPEAPLRMPAFGEQLSEEETGAVVEYLKSLWSEEHLRWQWEVTLEDSATTPPGTPASP